VGHGIQHTVNRFRIASTKTSRDAAHSSKPSFHFPVETFNPPAPRFDEAAGAGEGQKKRGSQTIPNESLLPPKPKSP